MKSFFAAIIIAISLALTFFACNSRQSKTESKDANAITVTNAWARPAQKGANSAAYLTIYNGTTKADTLFGVKTEAAGMASVHQTYRNKGMTGMRHADTIVIQPGTKLVLEAGGYHLMLVNLTRSLQMGDTLTLRLTFANAGKRAIAIPVK